MQNLTGFLPVFFIMLRIGYKVTQVKVGLYVGGLEIAAVTMFYIQPSLNSSIHH